MKQRKFQVSVKDLKPLAVTCAVVAVVSYFALGSARDAAVTTSAVLVFFIVAGALAASMR